MTYFLKKISNNDKNAIQRMFLECSKEDRVLDLRSIPLHPHEGYAKCRVDVCEYGYGEYNIFSQHIALLLKHEQRNIGLFISDFRAYHALETKDRSVLELDIDSVFVLPEYRGKCLWRLWFDRAVLPMIAPYGRANMMVKTFGNSISQEGAKFKTFAHDRIVRSFEQQQHDVRMNDLEPLDRITDIDP